MDIEEIRRADLKRIIEAGRGGNWLFHCFGCGAADNIVHFCLDKGTEKEAEQRAASILKAGANEVKIINLPDLVSRATLT